MANADKPNGGMASRHQNGGSYLSENKYSVDVSNSTAIFLGDFIILESDGNVAPSAVTTGGVLLGTCTAVLDDYGNLNRRYLPATTAGNIMVADSPNQIFTVQEDDDGTALTSAARGANCDVLATAGSTTTGKSAHEIDRSSVTNATAQLRLQRIVERDDNAHGDSAEWEVIINEHALKTTTGV